MLATDTLNNRSRLTLSDAAKRGLGGYSTLRKKIASGELPAERVGRRYLIDESDLAALVTPVVGRPTERASINTAIDRIVATAPRLSREQRDRLASLLGGAA
jgi:excisionase family DNA binding protein